MARVRAVDRVVHDRHHRLPVLRGAQVAGEVGWGNRGGCSAGTVGHCSRCALLRDQMRSTLWYWALGHATGDSVATQAVPQRQTSTAARPCHHARALVESATRAQASRFGIALTHSCPPAMHAGGPSTLTHQLCPLTCSPVTTCRATPSAPPTAACPWSSTWCPCPAWVHPWARTRPPPPCTRAWACWTAGPPCMGRTGSTDNWAQLMVT